MMVVLALCAVKVLKWLTGEAEVSLSELEALSTDGKDFLQQQTACNELRCAAEVMFCMGVCVSVCASAFG